MLTRVINKMGEEGLPAAANNEFAFLVDDAPIQPGVEARTVAGVTIASEEGNRILFNCVKLLASMRAPHSGPVSCQWWRVPVPSKRRKPTPKKLGHALGPPHPHVWLAMLKSLLAIARGGEGELDKAATAEIGGYIRRAQE